MPQHCITHLEKLASFLFLHDFTDAQDCLVSPALDSTGRCSLVVSVPCMAVVLSLFCCTNLEPKFTWLLIMC